LSKNRQVYTGGGPEFGLNWPKNVKRKPHISAILKARRQVIHTTRDAMKEQYHVDLENFSLEKFKQILEISDVLPSQKILKEKIAERFAILKSMGLTNLKELIEALSTKQKIERFAQASCLPQDYLVILKRRTGVYTPKPIELKELPGITPLYIERLAALGVKQTRQLFERAKSSVERAELAQQANVPDEVIVELVKLSDLVRAGYVGPAFARLLYETGVDTLEKLAAESPEALRQKLIAANNERRLYQAPIPAIKDFASWLDIVRELPIAIEY
jgi:predicted flap endonuclease-1-like 5' DNA nuclease